MPSADDACCALAAFLDALEPSSQCVGLEAHLARGDDESALSRIALHRPMANAFLQHGVTGAIGDSECTM